MTPWQLRYSRHAVQRMLTWDVSTDEVEAVTDSGETIEEYEDESRLILGWAGVRPIHVVVADRDEVRVRMVVTVYEPDPIRWQPGFQERRRP